MKVIAIRAMTRAGGPVVLRGVPFASLASLAVN
jgi:hypothetical protein